LLVGVAPVPGGCRRRLEMMSAPPRQVAQSETNVSYLRRSAGDAEVSGADDVVLDLVGPACDAGRE
jgi:hypothetical protein